MMNNNVDRKLPHFQANKVNKCVRNGNLIALRSSNSILITNNETLT